MKFLLLTDFEVPPRRNALEYSRSAVTHSKTHRIKVHFSFTMGADSLSSYCWPNGVADC